MFGFDQGAVEVHFRAMTYEELLSEALKVNSDSEVAASIDAHVMEVMAADRTPDKARARLLALAGES